MASNISCDFTTASGMLAAAIARIDEGGAGSVKIYSGTIPASVSVAISSEVLLAECPLSSTSFNAITDADPGAQAIAGPITSDTSANAGGDAEFFRIENGNGDEIIQGTAGEAADSTDMTLDNKTIIVGNTVSISNITLSHPES